MILFTSDSHNLLAMEIHKSIVNYGDTNTAVITFELEDQSKEKFDDYVEFNMNLDDVKQLYSFLGNILKSDWAKQKH